MLIFNNRIALCFYSSIRVIVRTSAHFSRYTPEGLQHINAHFTSHPQTVGRYGVEFDCDQLLDELLLSVKNFNTRGSGFVLDSVYNFTLIITQFRL